MMTQLGERRWRSIMLWISPVKLVGTATIRARCDHTRVQGSYGNTWTNGRCMRHWKEQLSCVLLLGRRSIDATFWSAMVMVLPFDTGLKALPQNIFAHGREWTLMVSLSSVMVIFIDSSRSGGQVLRWLYGIIFKELIKLSTWVWHEPCLQAVGGNLLRTVFSSWVFWDLV